MTKKEIKEKLQSLYEELDKIQEEDIAQDNSELMWEIGEAMGSIDNAIDLLE